MLSVIQEGHSYAKTWPMKPELSFYFVEFKVIKATQLASKVLPMLAVLSVCIQYQFLGTDYLPQAITFALFILSLPIQGFYWLGKRSNTPLPAGITSWYRDIHKKMEQQGCFMPKPAMRPKYKELANLLKRAFSEMDKAFTRDLF